MGGVPVVGSTVHLDLIILAGGRGKRMGSRVKPLLSGGASTLLEGLCRALPGARALVVAPAAIHDLLEPDVRRWASDLRRPVTRIEDPGKGPGLAVWAAVEALALEADAPLGRLLVTAADYPFPSVTLAERLLATAARGNGAWVVGPEGVPESLFAIVDGQALLEGAEQPPSPSVRKLFAALAMVPVAWSELSDEERRGLLDVDTPEEARQHGLDPAAAPPTEPYERRVDGARRRS